VCILQSMYETVLLPARRTVDARVCWRIDGGFAFIGGARGGEEAL